MGRQVEAPLMCLYCPGNMEELIAFSKFLFNIWVGGAKGRAGR